MATPDQIAIRSLHHVRTGLEEVHHEITHARSVQELHQAAKTIQKVKFTFNHLIQELEHPGQHNHGKVKSQDLHHIGAAIEKAHENIARAKRVTDANSFLILVGTAQHAVREVLHKLEGPGGSPGHQHHR